MTTRSSSYTRAGVHPTGCQIAGAQPGAPAGLPDVARIVSRSSGENFTVASRLLPQRTRRALLAVYAFARFTDEIGDSYAGDRLAALEWLERDLRDAIDAPGTGSGGEHGGSEHQQIVARVADLVRSSVISAQPLFDLVAANRQDQQVGSYAEVDDLIGYCRLSANPVGRLVLELFGESTPERVAWSDQICTGLQLAEHWQDVREDASNGRVYLPADDMRRFGVVPAELTSAGPATTGLKALMCFEAYRARTFLDLGAPLIRALSGRLRFAVAGFWAGGHAALDALAEQGYDPLVGTPQPSRLNVARRLGAAVCSPRRIAAREGEAA